MQIPILAGRDLEERDRPGSPAVAVINEVFAKANFGDRNPLGQHLILSTGRKEMVSHATWRSSGYPKRPLRRPDGDIPPVVYIPVRPGLSAAESNGVRAAHVRRSAPIRQRRARNGAAGGRATCRYPRSERRRRTSTRRSTRRSRLRGCAAASRSWH